jgi:hypothetical protein
MILTILKIIAAIATIATGLVSLFRPTAVTGFTGLSVTGPRGITEIRTILGALFVALGATPLLFNAPAMYQMLGIAYLVIGFVRFVSMLVDQSVVGSNVISLIAEIIFGVILVL